MNAYILGAVVQATVVQLKTLLGVEAPSHSGVFRLVYVREALVGRGRDHLKKKTEIMYQIFPP